MTDTLLQVLSNTDLDWMTDCGDRVELAAGDRLWQPHPIPDHFAVVVEGCLEESFAAASTAPDQAAVIYNLGPGDIVGVSPLLDAPSLTAVTALKPTQILSLPVAPLQAKLKEDVAFAARVYRGIALLLADRLRQRLEHLSQAQLGDDGSAGPVFDHRAGNDVLTVFGQLRDSDIDWLTAFGHTETIPADQVLLQAGRPVEALYILLEGQMAMSALQERFNPLALCFWGQAANTRDQPVFATLTQGSMPGIMAFQDFRPLPVTVWVMTECLVFAVPRQTLATKLQVDDSFASRFYRVVAMQILGQLQTIGLQLGEPGRTAMDDGELDMADLKQVTEGAKKFGWMLSQLGVNHHG